ncbi:alpha-amylase family glycosyl hydrolase [Pseudochryseolinea flava]|nr:alpha-amylase family glycosyl hydrolase [Pseudochryseolinea flava]
MMRKPIYLFLLMVPLAIQGQSVSEPPQWAKSVVWYELFVERFYNGDKSNDPTPSDINVPNQSEVPEGWSVTPWTTDWYAMEPWAKKMNKHFNEVVTFRRYGGDLEGVLQKLDYLKQLGITALYFRPLNDAPSLHKYDARSYHHIDANFGPDPVGDRKIIASENPNDPTTWQWTSADKLFLKVIDEAHKRNMKVVLDYSWNHTGIMFWAFQDILKNQEKSAYKDWYMIKLFDDPTTPSNEFAYDGWIGIQSLPEIKKVDVTTLRRVGHPYEGDILPAAKKHMYDVSRRWLAPNGNTKQGVDGYRLDVADHVGLKFWREFRKEVRSIKPDAYLVGEIWWQKWPEEFMNPAPYTGGDVFDAVMFYHVYRPARYFFAKTDFEIDAKQFKDSLVFQWNRVSPATRDAMMNVSSSADAPRLLTDFFNRSKYKKATKPGDDPSFKTGKPDRESYDRLKLYLIHAFTNYGAPHVYNGEELGMWGSDDPDDRKPLWWKEYTFEPENRNNFQPTSAAYDPVGFNAEMFEHYKKLIAIRNSKPVLVDGKFEFLTTQGKMLSYVRRDGKHKDIVVLFNLEESEKDFQVPHAQYVDLMTNKKVKGSTIKMKPYSGLVLEVVK